MSLSLEEAYGVFGGKDVSLSGIKALKNLVFDLSLKPARTLLEERRLEAARLVIRSRRVANKRRKGR